MIPRDYNKMIFKSGSKYVARLIYGYQKNELDMSSSTQYQPPHIALPLPPTSLQRKLKVFAPVWRVTAPC